MTTIPIELVLQDPDSPIVPTPDSNGSDESTLAAPNTALGEGYTTTDGSSDNNIFGGPSATVSMVSIVVLVLALGTIIALLVHKYHKAKKSDGINHSTKKERLATVATSTMAVLAATVLVGQLLMTATNAATADEGTTLDVADKIQIVANRYSDVTIVATTKNVSYATTDTTFGYKVFMSMAGDTANLYLDGDTSSEYYFAPTENAGLDDNSWGYSLNGKANYSAMPLADAPLMAQQNTSAVSDEAFTVYYTMKADKDMPFGIYKGEITYDIQGYNGFPSTLTTMQGMTSEICDAVYTPGGSVDEVVPTATLTDTRDGKTYEVAKLADGNCWMTQNLDLDLSTETELTPANTNISANWTPANSTIAFTGTTVDGWQNNNNVPYSADPGELYIYSSGTTNNDDQYTSLADCQAAHPDCSAKNHVGNYYNWSAAVATNDTSEITELFDNVETDICPAGWELPDGPNAEDDNSGDMISLIQSYNGIIEDTIHQSCGSGLGEGCDYYNYLSGGFNAIRTAPLWLARSGSVTDGSLSRTGSGGNYWSSTVRNSDNAFTLNFNSSGVNPANNSNGSNGYSVRCVAQ